MKEILYLRFAENEDIDDLLEWRNDELTRNNSFQTDLIEREDHKNWFEKSMKNYRRNIFIALNSNLEKIGQIRFDRTGNFAEIDIILSPGHRKKGMGSVLLEKACRHYLNNFEVDFLIAKIRNNNIASIKIFEKCGFQFQTDHGDHKEYRLKK